MSDSNIDNNNNNNNNTAVNDGARLITIVNLFSGSDNSASTRRLRRICSRARTPYLLFNLSPSPLFINSEGLRRIVEVMTDTSAAALYTDYISRSRGDEPDSEIRLEDYQTGSVREDFDFGYAIAVDTAKMRHALGHTPVDYEYAGLYDLRLRLSRMAGGIVHLRETLYSHCLRRPDDSGSEAAHFAYQLASNHRAQEDYEQTFASHLKAIGAWLPERAGRIEANETAFPIVASVVIPVKNRVRTIRDAVESALSQKCDFPFNVIVVDNQSTDGTSELLREMSIADPRLIRVNASNPRSGIGGCWNTAIAHRLCGCYAVQLDSDDRYSSPDSLQKIVDAFRASGAAMVVGCYTITNFEFKAAEPPVVIEHREWTAANGHNNLLRVNGIGAPRAFLTEVARKHLFPPTCYGEDYAMALYVSRIHKVERVCESIYDCRRWNGNSDSGLDRARIAANNRYKDQLRSIEIEARIRLNHPRRHD